MSLRQNNGAMSPHEQAILEKIRSLPRERALEVEDFIDFLHRRNEDRRLIKAAFKLSEKAFQEVWDNPDDAEYDKL